MANHNFFDRIYSLEKKPVILWAKAAIGTTGAITVDAARSLGVSSIARTDVGAYTITLKSTYAEVLGVYACFEDGTTSAVKETVIVSEDVDGAKTILIQFYDATTGAVEATDGAVVRFRLELRDAKVD